MSYKNCFTIRENMGNEYEIYYDCKYDCLKLLKVYDIRKHNINYIKLEEE
jgi:hypothetical protein